MKKGIHPEYKPVIFHDVGVDFRVLTRSTRTSDETAEWEDGNSYPVIHVDLSSASHSFYTGKQLLISERGGRVEQFRKRYAASLAEEAEKKANRLIEEMYKKSKDDVDQKIRDEGEGAILEADVHGLHQELVRAIGRLRFRTSYGQNVEGAMRKRLLITKIKS